MNGMGYDETENNLGPEEGLSADEARVREMLGGLKRVEAPKNFEFSLQARIANTRPEDLGDAGRGWGFLRYALPLALVLVASAAFVINGLYSVNENSVPVVADGAVTNPPAPVVPLAVSSPEEVAINDLPADMEPVANSNIEMVKKPGEELVAEGPRRSSNKRIAGTPETGGGSIDRGSTGPRPFFDLNNSTPRRSTGAPETTGQIEVEAILKIAGINAEFSDNGWKVRSVDSNSMSERSGVRAGDLIEAINGQPVTGGTKFSGRFNGRSLRVRRGAQTLEIELK